MTAPLLVADCVGKRFGDRKVLASASLRAVPGEIRVLAGRNGIGKSTLMKIAAGLTGADTGAVHFDGSVHLRPSFPRLARAGLFYLPDHDLLSAGFTLGEQLVMFERRYGRRSGIEAARMARVEEHLGKRRGQLSGGELRRAELALALTRRPRVLLADEPFRGIAPLDQAFIAELFRQMTQEGCAVVLTGHEVQALLDCADHVTWCTAGTTYELGDRRAAIANERFRLDYLGGRYE